VSLIVGGLPLALAGCSTPATPDNMASAAAPEIAAHPGGSGYRSMTVGDVQGGSDTNPLWLAGVSNADFHTALETSLKRASYLAEPGARGAYVVSARIEGLDRPTAGFDPLLVFAPLDWSVTVKIRYTVTPAAGGAPVFDELVAATGTASGDTAVTTDGRVRKSEEAAVRADIDAFLSRVRPSLR